MSMCEFCKHFKLGACALDIIECSSNSFTCPRWTADWSQAKPLLPVSENKQQSLQNIQQLIDEHNKKFNDTIKTIRIVKANKEG